MHPPEPDLLSLAASIEREGARRWPHLGLSVDELVRALPGLPATIEASAEAWAEVYLVLGCVWGRSAAMRVFERELVMPVEPAVRRRGLSSDELAEVRQRVLIRLFVQRRGDHPVILHCLGRGRLPALVHVVAVREAMRLRTGAAPAELTLDTMGAYEPDLRGLDRARQQLAKTAFAEAVAELPTRDRCLLHLHYVRGVGGADLARMYAVHRSTTTRWLESARQHLLDAFRGRLQVASPGLLRAERDRFDAWFHSQIDLSLSRLFGAAA